MHALYPVELNAVPEILGSLRGWVGVDEIYNGDFQILHSLVSRLVEMTGDHARVPVRDSIEVKVKSDLQFVFSLAYILYAALGAGDTINDIGAIAAHIMFGSVGSLAGCAKNSAACVQNFAVSAGSWAFACPVLVAGCHFLQGRESGSYQ